MRRHAGSFCLTLLLLLPASASYAETYFEAAQHLLANGQETEARRALNREINIRPRNLEARYNLAVLLERIGHNAQAAELYHDNIHRGRHLPSVVNLAAYLRTQKQTGRAITLLMQATKKYRAEAVPWYLLADIAAQQKKPALAEEYYEKSLKADRKNGFAHLRYAKFLAANGNIKQAARHASTALNLLPRCAPCQHIGGDIFEQAGKHKQALKAWQKSMALEPNAALRKKIMPALQAHMR
ncbi:MAG: tetratricopeptide repeat protein [Mariprofundaceae bacterium]|nr:tetratricopeptide repeat protein [Mariprofundaceae bacterium]